VLRQPHLCPEQPAASSARWYHIRHRHWGQGARADLRDQSRNL